MGIDARILVKTTTPLTETEVRKISAKMCSVIGASNFLLDREGKYGKPSHALQILDGPYTQDGDDVLPLPNEQFIEVNLMSRYYGIGYERGNWPILRTTMEFLELNIPNSTIWYGGDSSGVCVELFDKAKREELNTYFLTEGHEPYRSYSIHPGVVPVCEFCMKAYHDVGGGGAKVFYSCDGCGTNMVLQKGLQYILKEGESFFNYTR